MSDDRRAYRFGVRVDLQVRDSQLVGVVRDTLDGEPTGDIDLIQQPDTPPDPRQRSSSPDGRAGGPARGPG